jgi:hypothetical protein
MKHASAKGKNPKKKKKPGSPPVLQRDLNVRQVLTHLFELFEKLGIEVPRPKLPKRFKEKGDRVLHPLYPYSSAIGELLTHWHQDPAYLDHLGNPKRIKIRGRRPSLSSLARNSVPTLNLDYLTAELARLNAISVTGDLVRVNTRAFPSYEDKDLAIEHTLTTLDGFIRTLRHNLDSAPSNSDQLFHRIAQRSDFDMRELPALKVRLKRQGQSFLESFDNWLGRNSVSGTAGLTSSKKKTKVYVGVYLALAETK